MLCDLQNLRPACAELEAAARHREDRIAVATVRAKIKHTKRHQMIRNEGEWCKRHQWNLTWSSARACCRVAADINKNF